MLMFDSVKKPLITTSTPRKKSITKALRASQIKFKEKMFRFYGKKAERNYV